jgi:pimeloyl-ACP methyl ester carboxylesterase
MKKPRRKKNLLVYSIIVLVIVIGAGVYSDISVEELKKDYANSASQFVELDGMQVHFREEGEGFPIVLVHGTAASLHTWDDWTKELTKNYRVIRMDLPAFGLTGPNATRDYSIASYVKFLNDFLVTQQIDSFHLAGNSLGGNIAWNYALEHPQKVDKLILIDASGIPLGDTTPWIFKMARTPVLNKGFLYYTPKFLIEKNLKEVYEDDSKITEELLTRYHKMAIREGNRQAFVDRAQLDSKEDSITTIERLRTLQHETLLIWGAKDTWIPLSHGKAMDVNIPNSQLKVLKNSGHVPMEENPEESVRILKTFLEKE